MSNEPGPSRVNYGLLSKDDFPLRQPVNPNPTPQEVGARIRKIRRAKKLSQDGLAARAGFVHGYVRKIEAGAYDPPLSILNAFAKALGVSTAELMQ
jgi:predicted transcriptional regulator